MTATPHPCITCVDLDTRMKLTNDDVEWNELLSKLELHRRELHTVSEEDADNED